MRIDAPPPISSVTGEPALDAAVQMIVVERLVVRLMRAAGDQTLLAGVVDREPPSPIAAAVGRVGVTIPRSFQLSANAGQSAKVPKRSRALRMSDTSTNARILAR